VLAPPALVALRWRPFRLPLRQRFEAAHGASGSREGVLLQLVAAGGGAGVGEASPTPSLGDGAVADVLVLLESHADALLARPEQASAALPEGPGVAALRCAFDTALLDLVGRARGCSIAALLAAAPARSVTANAVIGLGTPDEVVGYARAAAAAGYGTVKLKVGSDHSGDVMRVEAVRRALPDVRLRLDANGAWSEVEAAAVLARLAPLGIELVEQPVAAEDVAALARLSGAAGMPLAADEAVCLPGGAERVLAARAASLVVLKPMRLGGVRPALALARRATAAGMGAFVTTTFDSSIGTATALQLAGALPAGGPAHGLATGEQLAADIVARSLVPERGVLALPAAPGLGIDVDDRVLDAVSIGRWVERRR
jgi:o-succinylbenzoate synthase